MTSHDIIRCRVALDDADKWLDQLAADRGSDIRHRLLAEDIAIVRDLLRASEVTP